VMTQAAAQPLDELQDGGDFQGLEPKLRRDELPYERVGVEQEPHFNTYFRNPGCLSGAAAAI
jgi:hypothetical protein